MDRKEYLKHSLQRKLQFVENLEQGEEFFVLVVAPQPQVESVLPAKVGG
jgi:hypothetical protein